MTTTPEGVCETKCPKCGDVQEDHDGFGTLHCEKCGYCTHASITDGVCQLCGKPAVERVSVAQQIESASKSLAETPDRYKGKAVERVSDERVGDGVLLLASEGHLSAVTTRHVQNMARELQRRRADEAGGGDVREIVRKLQEWMSTDQGPRYVLIPRELASNAIAALTRPMEDRRDAVPMDWSLCRRILEQGMAIQMDYAAGAYPTYEHLSARLDQAARERVDAARLEGGKDE